MKTCFEKERLAAQRCVFKFNSQGQRDYPSCFRPPLTDILLPKSTFVLEFYQYKFWCITSCINMAYWYDLSKFYLHMHRKSSVQSEIWLSALLLCKYMFASTVLPTCFFLAKPLGTVFWNKTFCLVLFFFLFFFFNSAASDHYLIGNNITVAVLGIVIPIGEYSWLSCCVASAFCPPASPSSLLRLCLSLKSCMLGVWMWCFTVCVWLYVCMCTCTCVSLVFIWEFALPPDLLKRSFILDLTGTIVWLLNMQALCQPQLMFEYKIIV